MRQTTVEEIEFETTNELIDDSEARQGYRIPAHTIGKVVIEIYGSKFDIVDVGPAGIGILINYDKLFSSSEDLGTVTITIGKKNFTLWGTVVHITPHELNKFHCGITLSSLFNNDEKPAYEKAVYDLRKKIFSNNKKTF